MKTKIALTTIGIFIKTYMLVSFIALLADKSKRRRRRSRLIHILRKHHASISEG
jgi:hypothetical protein